MVDQYDYDSGYLTCSKKLTGSQLSLPHGINKQKIKCECEIGSVRAMLLMGVTNIFYYCSATCRAFKRSINKVDLSKYCVVAEP